MVKKCAMGNRCKTSRTVSYQMRDDGKFVIKNYDLAKPFASFFPGIAGLYGVPMWGFYVNRGQGVVSFGTKDKDRSIMEFFSADRAWQLVSTQGFRTFIKIKNKGQCCNCYEPFNNTLANNQYKIERNMLISPYDMTLIETNETLGIVVEVHYFTLCNEPLASLIREVKVRNISQEQKTLEIIDPIMGIYLHDVP